MFYIVESGSSDYMFLMLRKKNVIFNGILQRKALFWHFYL